MEYTYGWGIGFNQFGDKICDAARKNSKLGKIEIFDGEVFLNQIGSSEDTLNSQIIFGTAQQLSASHIDEAIAWVCGCLPASPLFWGNWEPQVPAFRKTTQNFFGSTNFLDAPVHVRIQTGRMCFANAIKKQYGIIIDPYNSENKTICSTYDGLNDVKVPMPRHWAEFVLPLSGVRFKTFPIVCQITERSESGWRRHLATWHLSYGSGLANDRDRQFGEFLRSTIEKPIYDPTGLLLYVDNFDIVLTRYLPTITRYGKLYNVHQINWNIDPIEGYTTGISVTTTNSLDPNVMIPGLKDHLEQIVETINLRDVF